MSSSCGHFVSREDPSPFTAEARVCLQPSEPVVGSGGDVDRNSRRCPDDGAGEHAGKYSSTTTPCREYDRHASVALPCLEVNEERVVCWARLVLFLVAPHVLPALAPPEAPQFRLFVQHRMQFNSRSMLSLLRTVEDLQTE